MVPALFADIGAIWCNFYLRRDSDLNISEMIKKIVSVINILTYVSRQLSRYLSFCFKNNLFYIRTF